MNDAYALGVQLALEESGLTKTASPRLDALKELLHNKKLLYTTLGGAGVGGLGGALVGDEEDRLRNILLGAGLGGAGTFAGGALGIRLSKMLNRALSQRAARNAVNETILRKGNPEIFDSAISSL